MIVERLITIVERCLKIVERTLKVCWKLDSRLFNDCWRFWM